MRNVLAFAVLSLAPLVGAADCTGLCDTENDPNCVDPQKAQVEGTITVPQAGGAAFGLARVDVATARSLKQAMSAARAHGVPSKLERVIPRNSQNNRVPAAKTHTERFRNGEAVVRGKEPIRERRAEVARALEITLEQRFDHRVHVDLRLCGSEYRCLADLTDQFGKKLDLADTAEAAIVLSHDPLLLYAEKNLILQPALEPNDEFFTLQWHYAAINMPDAWDITTGDPSRVAAIVDTGVLYNHPDLTDRVVSHGADLIDDPSVANDGDGRDDDGFDAGDNECGAGCNSFHGSHVSGTIGASTNNGTMVAGITWDGGLLPVRVLGDGGGSLSDIADGIEWAVGRHVDGVSDNATPADVINMSLGGAGQSDAMDEAIADAVSTGCIVLVAAGNDNQDASNSTPANSPDAIVVAAHGNTGPSRTVPKRASYSNFGDKVDIAAPGGEQAEDVDGDGQGDGVLSTVDQSVVYYQGTSMATPHVAGVAMLLKSLDPTLQQEDVRNILKQSAQSDLDCPEGCGAGRLNAAAALLQSQGSIDGAHVIASPSFVRVGKGQHFTPVVFRNIGTASDDVTFDVAGADRTACAIDSAGGSVASGDQIVTNVTITRNDTADDSGECDVAAGATSARVVWTADAVAPLTSVDVGAVLIGSDGSLTVKRLVTTTDRENFEYKLFNLDPGNYLIVGAFDANNNGSYDDDVDAIGIFVPKASGDSACTSSSDCGRVALAAGQTLQKADFVVATGFAPGDGGTGGTGNKILGDGCTDSSECGGGLYCELTLPGGYCTNACQSDTDCHDGICASLEAATGEVYQACLKSCTGDSDCRTAEAYACDTSDQTCFPAP